MYAEHGSVSLIGDTPNSGKPQDAPSHLRNRDIMRDVVRNPPSIQPQNLIYYAYFASGLRTGEVAKAAAQRPPSTSSYSETPVSSGARGCTFESTGYDISIDGTPFRIHDTVGLEDGEHGRIPTSKAIVQLYSLLRRLEGGVSLLIFCMKAPRVKESAKHNWILFYDIICQCRVPIAIVVTGLEQERDMDGWWNGNEKTFRQYGMHSHGHACITAIRGKKKSNGQYSLQREYDESMLKVKNMIKTCYQEKPRPIERVHWFQRVVYETTYEHHCWGTEVIKTKVGDMKGAMDELVDRCGMPKKDAEALAKELNKIK
ncbi:hypothetical protein NLJ89_g5168 [Agrocybe chaxingu]|uniref:Uncharacterized protein n=1 Tax=Agrocybe chaxingu TaxID=84603 RepID=A0A9W8MV94_9AGAR|nr:hypothetical protein NLJ89_g5168 [Agrocybe chaxingu]